MNKPTKYRDNYCGCLDESLVSKKVRVCGWIENIRDHGGVVFLDLRDESGVVQLVSNDDSIFSNLTKESVIMVFIKQTSVFRSLFSFIFILVIAEKIHYNKKKQY